MSLTEQGLTVNGEAPAYLLMWLTAIEAAHKDVIGEPNGA